MKPYEVWEGNHWLYASSWDTLEEASQEANQQNTAHNSRYFLRKINESGQYLDKSKW